MTGNRDMEIFCRQMGTLLKSGVNLSKAFDILVEQTEGRNMKKTVARLRSAVKNGDSLSEGMRKDASRFPDIAIHMVRAGEEAGCLDVAFLKLAAYFHKREQMRGSIQKTMIYPVILLTACVGIVIAMVAWVVPMYTEIFESLGTEMPPMTAAMLKISDFLRQYGCLIGGILAGAAVSVCYWNRRDSGKFLRSFLMLKVPGIKGISVRYSCIQFCGNLSMLLAAGEPLLEGIRILSDTMDNYVYRLILAEGVQKVREGSMLSEVLRDSRYFLPVVWHMAGIGEETGKLEEMLDSAADYCEDEAEMMVKKLGAAAEPMVVLVMAVVVAIVIGAIYSPVLRVYDSISIF